jgi:TldD protein
MGEGGMIDSIASRVFKENNHFADIRYVENRFETVTITNGELDQTTASEKGIFIRRLQNGLWYNTIINDLDKGKTVVTSHKAVTSKIRGDVNVVMSEPVRGRFILSDLDEDGLVEDKISFMRNIESILHDIADLKSYTIGYSNFNHRKRIVNNAGTDVYEQSLKPEFSVNLIVKVGNKNYTLEDGVGITGSFTKSFREKILGMCNNLVTRSHELKKAKLLRKKRGTVIVSPPVVGILLHEAIGHLAEADFVISGSPLGELIGKKVTGDSVTVVDTPTSKFVDGAAGSIAVDDEGTMVSDAVIIDRGTVKHLMSDKQTAYKLNIPLTGNGRTESYSSMPQVRMRNTIMYPGNVKLEEIIEETDDGYMIDVPMDGEADSNGFFQFTVGTIKHIIHGSIEEIGLPGSITGSIFDFLKNISYISSDFSYGIGSGWCIKAGDAVKVDGGGPYIRTEVNIG